MKKTHYPIKELRKTATAILEEQIDFLEGVRTICDLRGSWKNIDDPIFHMFILIDSEADHLPSGETRKLWANNALEKCDKELKEIYDFYRNDLFAACNNLIAAIESLESN